LLKNWSNYEHVKHAKIKKHPVEYNFNLEKKSKLTNDYIF
jgi:hypothetical protein